MGWYAVTIPPALAAPGRIQTLRFGRVMYHTKAWLNGEPLGENIGGYLPFEFDVTGKLRRAKPNTLVLRVDNKPRLDWLPASRNIEWMQYGGILAPVVVETSARLFVSDLTIHAVPQGAGATVDCIVEIRSREDAEKLVTLRVAMGAATKSAVVKLAPGATVRERVTIALPRAQRWSPSTPFLYTLRASLEHAGEAIDSTSARFGVRRIETRGRDILLNGERLYLKGVNRYDEYGRYGVNPPRQLVVEDLRRMKSAGVNFVRVHFPQSPELISLYDEMGDTEDEHFDLEAAREIDVPRAIARVRRRLRVSVNRGARLRLSPSSRLRRVADTLSPAPPMIAQEHRLVITAEKQDRVAGHDPRRKEPPVPRMKQPPSEEADGKPARRRGVRPPRRVTASPGRRSGSDRR